jgi:DNA-binding NarL/FixJ family response regulator
MTCTAAVHRPTRWTYQRYGCRCPETVEVVRASQREARRTDRHRTPNVRARKRHSDYVDEIAVERACRGDVVELTAEERTAAILRLDGLGLTARQIGDRLGVCSRTVRRHLTKAGQIGDVVADSSEDAA